MLTRENTGSIPGSTYVLRREKEMAPSSGHEDRSERKETASEGDTWFEDQEEVVRESVAGNAKSLGLRKDASTNSAGMKLTEKT